MIDSTAMHIAVRAQITHIILRTNAFHPGSRIARLLALHVKRSN